MDDESGVVAEVREFYTTRRKQVTRKKAVTEEMGQTLSSFVDKTELNKTAVGIAARLDGLTAEKRADVLRSLDSIREAMSGVWSQEETGEMDFGGGSTGVAAAQEFERARKKKPTVASARADLAKAVANKNAKAEAARLKAAADFKRDAEDAEEVPPQAGTDELEHLH
jgi:hypothetical protein